jgi:membrane-bound lytic murein transglycosylase D
VPASPTRFQLALSLAAISMIAACSGRSPDAGAPSEPPREVVASLQQEAIRQARLELERGEGLARDGQWREARLAFDRAVDLLLYIPGGVEASEDAKALYGDVVATVHEMEREYQAQLADTAIDGEADAAAVDELTTDAALIEPPEVLGEDLPAAPESAEEALEATYDIPMEINARVLSIVEMFQTQKREWFQEALDRGALYIPLFERVLGEEGLPKDLVYLSMIESAFKPRAVSRAGARGLWQFIAGTGKLYGLRQDYWVDDRFDPEKATRAAARHLKDLYDEFGDWYLAMAAYNAGPRRIERAIQRTGNRDFWTLAQKRYLPRETRSYVPLILAATIIGKNPEAYGFTRPPGSTLEYDVAELDSPIDLETAAKSAGATVDEMKLLNPELRHWVTPLDRESYPLKIPKGSRAAFDAAVASIPEGDRVRFGAHVVERGDTLSRIARRYGTTIEALASANNMRTRTLIHPGQVLTVPVPPGSLSAYSSSGARKFREASRNSIPEGDQEIYVVARGDTLGAIADSFRMSLSALRALNDLPPNSSRIHPGQRLVVSSSAGRPAAAPPSSSSKPRAIAGAGGTYTVRPGDTLGAIADAHGVGLSTLRRLNGMGSRATRIYAGQTLVVSEAAEAAAVADASETTAYRIRRGDTLTTIARRFGVSVEELRRWNQIDSDRIVVGQSITVRASGGSQ